jgi:hypothetical protein
MNSYSGQFIKATLTKVKLIILKKKNIFRLKQAIH